MYTTAPIVITEAKLATTDATLAMFLVAAQLCLWELSQRDSRRLAATFWILLALATLTKGPVGLALIAAAGLASWWCGGPTAMWKRLQWRWGLALFVLIVAPWFLAVGWKTQGEFFRYAVGKEMAERVVTQMEQHGGFPGYYLVTGAVFFHPWAALLPAAYCGAWTRRRSDPMFGFLLGWVFGPMILLECVQTKLVHYFLPAFPACALLVSWLIGAVVRHEINLSECRLGRCCMNLFVAIGISIGAVFITAAIVLPRPLTVPCLTASILVTTGTLWGRFRLQHGATESAVVCMAATSGLTMLLLGGWLLPAAEPYRMPRIVAEKLMRHATDQDAPPVFLGLQEPSMVYTMGRPATAIRTWDHLYAEVDRNGAVVTAITDPVETKEFDKHLDLQVKILERVEGFNLNKGSNQHLHLAVIRRKDIPPRDDQITRAVLEKKAVAR